MIEDTKEYKNIELLINRSFYEDEIGGLKSDSFWSKEHFMRYIKMALEDKLPFK